MELLSKVAAIEPQSAYCVFTSGFKHKVTYIIIFIYIYIYIYIYNYDSTQTYTKLKFTITRHRNILSVSGNEKKTNITKY